jgi:nitrate/TMAO reductase-like tetraheme cytochrome c subunit
LSQRLTPLTAHAAQLNYILPEKRRKTNYKIHEKPTGNGVGALPHDWQKKVRKRLQHVRGIGAGRYRQTRERERKREKERESKREREREREREERADVVNCRRR